MCRSKSCTRRSRSSCPQISHRSCRPSTRPRRQGRRRRFIPARGVEVCSALAQRLDRPALLGDDRAYRRRLVGGLMEGPVDKRQIPPIQHRQRATLPTRWRLPLRNGRKTTLQRRRGAAPSTEGAAPPHFNTSRSIVTTVRQTRTVGAVRRLSGRRHSRNCDDGIPLFRALLLEVTVKRPYVAGSA